MFSIDSGPSTFWRTTCTAPKPLARIGVEKIMVFLFLFQLSIPGLGGDLSDDQIQSLTQMIDTAVQQHPGPPIDDEIPGLALAIHTGSGEPIVITAGYANPTSTPITLVDLDSGRDVVIPARTPITADSLFEAASVTKTFTTALVLRQIDEGIVAEDTPLAAWFPAARFLIGSNCSWRDRGNCPTLAQLLAMRAGIADIYEPCPDLPIPTPAGGDKEGFGDLAQHQPGSPPLVKGFLGVEYRGSIKTMHSRFPPIPTQPRQAFRFLARNPPCFEPDTQFWYSNAAFVLLGFLETGTRHPAALADAYTHLADLADTQRFYLGLYEPTPDERRVVGWTLEGEAPPDRRTFFGEIWSAGAIMSGPAALAEWIYQLYQEGVVLSAESLALMTTVELFQSPIIDRYRYEGNGHGMQWYVAVTEDGTEIDLYGHAGATSVAMAKAVYLPDYQIGFALLANRTNSAAGFRFVELMRDIAIVLAE